LKQAAADLHMHDQPRLDAEVLLAHVLNKPRSYLHAWPETELSDEQASLFARLVRQRAEGQPVAHLTGRREFWSLELSVTPATLIPRPETELLVERALALLPENIPLKVADFGTGSGAIALALGHERRQWQVYAIDRSPDCLRIAQRNARRLRIPNVSFINSDWSQAIADHALDAIIANPPYVASGDPHLDQGDVRFEPLAALASGADGLDDLTLLVTQAPRVLKPGGWILLEHGMDQGQSVRNLLKEIMFSNIHTVRDLAGLERITSAQNPA